MKTIKIIILFILLDPTAYADINIKAQQEDQSLCVQQRLEVCIQRLCATKEDTCVQTCRQNIENECRYAGE